MNSVAHNNEHLIVILENNRSPEKGEPIFKPFLTMENESDPMDFLLGD